MLNNEFQEVRRELFPLLLPTAAIGALEVKGVENGPHQVTRIDDLGRLQKLAIGNVADC